MNRKRTRSPGLGIGYVSIMLIFAIIGLTMLAVMSFQAVYADTGLTNKSVEYTQQYYDADSRAKQILAELDEAALNTEQTFFTEEFAERAQEISAGEAAATTEGVRVDYSVQINERQNLYVRVEFFAQPNGERFRIDRWQLGTEQNEASESLGVWDGTF